MEIGIKTEGDHPVFSIKYTEMERRRVQDSMEELGLEVKTTKKAFGRCLTVKYFRDRDGTLLKELYGAGKKGYFALVDDINSSLFVPRQFFNIAVFRVVPDRRGVVELPVTSYISHLEAKQIEKTAKTVVKRLLNAD